ncbi:MAG: indole-3-glycerol phosphate synthase [Candidatus Pelagibacter sp.]|nr:indole-3-glycerol phosphate synthase [Candidatus Pelagibacter sp.]OUV87290.1 MAG: indole-3-glycerol phosphate synthase [Pelagibacteraceae bacterium TMED136]|tara:strand:- start:48811 stop:49599 length:789 start_codon:yes stop_codon:yes gene_type:complete
MNILEKIIIDKKKEVETDKILYPLNEIKKCISFKKNLFSQNLKKFKNNNIPAIIAEIKKASPSKGILVENFNHLDIAGKYVENNAACLSVLTEKKYFLGNKKYIGDIKKKYNIPILNKDFFIDTYQVYEANKNGADCILIIISATSNEMIKSLINVSLELGMDYILEVHNEKEMEIALNFSGAIIGINNRNLQNFEVSLDNTIRIFKEFESSLKNKTLISESGFKDKNDLIKIKNETGINNYLIGESLIKSDSIKECFQKFI